MPDIRRSALRPGVLPSPRFDDGDLMTRAQAGSTDAFGELFDRYRERSYRVSSSVCHDVGRAEDAVQEAFLSIWRNRDTYRAQQGTVAAWLLAVVRYRAIDAARRNDRHASRRADDDGLERQPAPDDVADQVHARADASRLGPLLARIPVLQREVIALAFYGGLTHVEIAARLGLPPGTVKGRMRLGLNRLRDELRRTELV
jgi:RNA polymerase sigma-70 factor (ECF subfamily)